ncbi:MAG: DsbE family thiol:disulfide interchange protein [Maricaulaceae bacterium]
MRWWTLAPLAGFVGLAVFFAVATLKPADPLADALNDPLVGRPAPSVDLPRLAGEGRFATPTLTGAPYVVNFWASWCPPCRVEHPLLMELAGDGWPLHGIAYSDAPDASRTFLEALGDPFKTIGVDRDRQAGLAFGLTGVPETVVVDAQGVVRARWRGPLTEEVVERVLSPALTAAEAEAESEAATRGSAAP